LGALHHSVRRLIHRGWFAIGEILGRITSTIILTLVYGVLLVPMALLSRLLRKKNPMQLKNKAGSLFDVVVSTFTAEDLVEQW